ncbi:MAG: DUF4926 domain-containing protein [Ardenticatenaceae bacterium]|nr:DUF4926 domain-containing protein [Ardenticatenaceae bacterium]
MVKKEIQNYQTVRLLESIGAFPKGELGAIVEVYTFPYETYDVEIVTDDGQTKGLLEAVRPEQIEVVFSPQPQLTAVSLAPDGTKANIRFADGTEIILTAADLYAHAVEYAK